MARINLTGCSLTCFMILRVILGDAGVANGRTAIQRSLVQDLKENAWISLSSGEWMVMIYAPWCLACDNLTPTWEHFALNAAEFDVNVAKIDINIFDDLPEQYFSPMLPKILHIKDGEFREYTGEHTFDSFMLYLESKMWENDEPSLECERPNAIQSYVLALKDSIKGKNEEHIADVWQSYTYIIISSFFLGTGIGILFVLCQNYLYHSRNNAKRGDGSLNIEANINREQIQTPSSEENTDSDTDEYYESQNENQTTDNESEIIRDNESENEESDQDLEVRWDPEIGLSDAAEPEC